MLDCGLELQHLVRSLNKIIGVQFLTVAVCLETLYYRPRKETEKEEKWCVILTAIASVMKMLVCHSGC